MTPPTATTGTPTTVLVPAPPPAGAPLTVSPTKLAVARQAEGGPAPAASMVLERLRGPGARGTSRGHILASPRARAGSEAKDRPRWPYGGGEVTVASEQLLTGFAAQRGPSRASADGGSASEKGAGSSTDRLRPRDRPASSLTITVPAGERLIDGQEAISIGSPWDGGSMDASTSQRVPFALGGLILIFVLVQWLIDRRDPKLVEAPARRHEDSIGFE